MAWWVWILVGIGCMGWMRTTLWLVSVRAWRRPRAREVEPDDDEGMHTERRWFG